MIINSLYIISGLIGFIISAILFSNRKSNPLMNIYMILLILIVSCRSFIYGVIHLISNPEIIIIYKNYSYVTFVVIPICYLYLKKLQTEKIFEKKDLYHFIFPFIYIIAKYEINSNTAPSFISKLIMYLCFLSFLIYYVFLSYSTLKNNIWNKHKKSNFTKKQFKKRYNWTVFLFVALAITSTRLAISLLIELFTNDTMTGLPYQWVSTLIWLILQIKIIVTPEILYGYKILNEKVQENRTSNLKFNEIWQLQAVTEINNVQHLALKEKIDKNLQNYFEEIEKKSLESDYFREQNFKIDDLANKLNIPKSHLSYVFKYHSTISFSEFKKIIRIYDAVQLIENGYLKNNTLDSLSKKIGFTSYNPFFTSFKEIIGIAPNEYTNSIQVIAQT